MTACYVFIGPILSPAGSLRRSQIGECDSCAMNALIEGENVEVDRAHAAYAALANSGVYVAFEAAHRHGQGAKGGLKARPSAAPGAA